MATATINYERQHQAVGINDFANSLELYRTSLYKHAMRLTGGDSSLAQDLVQETYLRALRFSNRFKQGTNLNAWLHAILRNYFISYKIERLREHPLTGEDTHFGLPETSDSQYAKKPMFVEYPNINAQNGLKVDLERAFRRFSDGSGASLEVVLRHEVLGETIDEIAAKMNTPSGTVKSREHRIKGKLREVLQDYQEHN